MRQRTRATRRKRPPDPDVRRLLSALISGLTDPDEDRRRKVVAAVFQKADALLLGLIVDRLIAAMRRGGGPVRRRASVALASMGQAALPAVLLALHKGRSAPVRLCLAETVAAIGAGLDPHQRISLFFEIEIIRDRCEQEDIARACTRAIAVMGLGPVGRRK